MGSSAIFDAIEKGDALEVKNLAGAESVREFVLEEVRYDALWMLQAPALAYVS